MNNPELSSPVTSLTYYLTEACNLRCTYCYIDKNPKRSSLEVGRAAIDFLIQESGRQRALHLRFFGGEPLLELDLMKEIVAYGKERCAHAGKQIRFDMISNGTLFHTDTVDALSAMGVTMITSVDGARRTMQINRPFYQQKESFDGFDEKLRYAIAQGVGKVARMTVSPNQVNIVDNIRHLLDLGYPSIMICLATNVPWPAETIDGIYQGLSAFYIETARQGSILPLQATNELLVRRHEIEHDQAMPHENGFCAAGKEMLGVSVHGDLYPCHRYVPMGTEHRIGDVFNGIHGPSRDPFLQVRTHTLHHDMCNTCHAERYCPGSCMAANLTATGDAFYPETRHCLDLRAHVTAVNHIYETLMGEACPALVSFLDRAWKGKRNALLASLLSEASPEIGAV